MRSFFRVLNKYFMIPMFRIGFGPFIGNPITGYIMVLKTIGRRTGKIRFTPVNYAIIEGSIFCVSGYRQGSDWYHNLLTQPAVEAILPGGTIAGKANEVFDPASRRIAIRKIFQNAGFAGFMGGYNPFRIGDEQLLQRTADMPLIRIEPASLGSGASDPGGWAWFWMPVFTILLVLVLWLILR